MLIAGEELLLVARIGNQYQTRPETKVLGLLLNDNLEKVNSTSPKLNLEAKEIKELFLFQLTKNLFTYTQRGQHICFPWIYLVCSGMDFVSRVISRNILVLRCTVGDMKVWRRLAQIYGNKNTKRGCVISKTFSGKKR